MPETLTSPLEELSLDDLQYHTKVRARITAQLKQMDTVRGLKAEKLAFTQGWVEALEWVLKLPQTIYEEAKING